MDHSSSTRCKTATDSRPHSVRSWSTRSGMGSVAATIAPVERASAVASARARCPSRDRKAAASTGTLTTVATGVGAGVFQQLSRDADNEYAMIDSTIVRAHQHSAGARKKPGRKPLGGAKAG